MSGLVFNWKKQPRWKFWLARLFGERIAGDSDGYRVVAYRWRGAWYITEVSE